MKLDALAAGDSDVETAAHIAACAACAEYVARLGGDAAVFRATNDAGAFANVVLARAGQDPVVRISPRRARVVWYAAPVLAAAAALLLWVGSAPVHPLDVTGATTGTAGDLRFKGGLSVVAIRERAGTQDRLSGPFSVAPEDRLRVEVSQDKDGPITAGLLAADGTWTPLLAPAELSAGTHFSELAARFDATPTDALLLVGAPEDVARARTTGRFDGIIAWRVRSESAR
jgi:hypothetical protein